MVCRRISSSWAHIDYYVCVSDLWSEHVEHEFMCVCECIEYVCYVTRIPYYTVVGARAACDCSTFERTTWIRLVRGRSMCHVDSILQNDITSIDTNIQCEIRVKSFLGVELEREREEKKRFFSLFHFGPFWILFILYLCRYRIRRGLRISRFTEIMIIWCRTTMRHEEWIGKLRYFFFISSPSPSFLRREQKMKK